MFLCKWTAVVALSVLTCQIQSEQPGCENKEEQFEFYKEFWKHPAGEVPPNFVCKANFKKKLNMCITVLRSHLMRGIETYYTLTEDEKTINKKCENREITFWSVNQTESRQVEVFKCPITKIRHEIISGYFVPPQTDFYITKGWSKHPKTIFMLRESNTTTNICVLGEYFWVD